LTTKGGEGEGSTEGGRDARQISKEVKP